MNGKEEKEVEYLQCSVLESSQYLPLNESEVKGQFEPGNDGELREKLILSYDKDSRVCRCLSADEIHESRIVTNFRRFGRLKGDMLKKVMNGLGIHVRRQQMHQAIGNCQTCALVKITA